MSSLTPLLFGASGPIPTPPVTLQQALIALVAAAVPGYTATLPGSLIDDMSGTAVGALATIDQARVDAINSVNPYSANAYLLAQLGQQFGIPLGSNSNGSALVVFSGTPGFVISPGFTVTDGTRQYVVQDGGVIGTSGMTDPLFVVSTDPGIFAIPANTITTRVTSVPTGYTVTCNNPNSGTPAQAAQTVESYRAQVLDAFSVAVTGTPTYLKTLLALVPGVSRRLISVLQNGTQWEVLCGGGDPYAVAAAIYAGVASAGLLVGSSTTPRNVTVSIFDPPDAYTIVYVNPPEQIVTVDVTWNTTLSDFTSANIVNQLIIAAVQAYVNSIVVGRPINLLVMDETIQQAVAPVLAASNLTTLEYAVEIDGTPVTPTAGTSIIPSDPEGFFFVSSSGVTSAQG